MTDIALLPCPFCGGAMMLRGALWPSEGDRDAIIHAAPTDCPMGDFSNDTFDESIVEVWNRRASPSQVAPANPAQVTDAIRGIVEDALNSAIPEPWEVAEHATQRILAAIGAGGQAVAVKPLEWRHYPDAFPPMWVATAAFGSYSIEEASGSDSPSYDVFHPTMGRMANVDGLPEAKAAAQADYERRILSALSQPHPADERVVEALSNAVGVIDTLIESLSEGLMTDAGLSKADRVGMKHQISALELAKDGIAALSPMEGRDNG